MPLRPSADEWRVHLALPGTTGGCAVREVWTGHPSTLDALWDARAMLRPQTTHQVDPHQVTSDFAGICDRLMANTAMTNVLFGPVHAFFGVSPLELDIMKDHLPLSSSS
eukprot:11521974-Heterocapsa_arctica.AAC.1